MQSLFLKKCPISLLLSSILVPIIPFCDDTNQPSVRQKTLEIPAGNEVNHGTEQVKPECRYKIKAVWRKREEKNQFRTALYFYFDESSSVWCRISIMLHGFMLSVDQDLITTSRESGANAILLFTV